MKITSHPAGLHEASKQCRLWGCIHSAYLSHILMDAATNTNDASTEATMSTFNAKSAALASMKTTSIVITEAPSGGHWQVAWDDQSSECFPSAVQAQTAVRERGKVAAEMGISTIAVIEWNPTTKIGLQVVRAIQ